MVLVMLGEGEAYIDGKLVPGREALAQAGLEPIELSGKEGLALINGTQIMTAVGCIAWQETVNLMKAADIAAALSLEGLKERELLLIRGLVRLDHIRDRLLRRRTF